MLTCSLSLLSSLVAAGTANEQELVLGGHAALWGEFVDSTNFLSRYNLIRGTHNIHTRICTHVAYIFAKTCTFTHICIHTCQSMYILSYVYYTWFTFLFRVHSMFIYNIVSSPFTHITYISTLCS